MDMKKVIAGSLAVLGVAATAYRVRELKKIRKAIEEEQIIDVEPEKVEEVSQNRGA